MCKRMDIGWIGRRVREYNRGVRGVKGCGTAGVLIGCRSGRTCVAIGR